MTRPEPPSSADGARPVPAWKLLLWPAILVVLAFGMWLLPWHDWVPLMRDWVASHGAWGGVVFVAVYVVVVILPLPAAAMSIAGGLAFGWWGYPLSMLGSVLGAIPPYMIGRHWLRGPLMRRFAGPRVRAADRAIGNNALIFVTLLRLTPILPFTAQNWLLGLTAIRLKPYLGATVIGLAPGTLAMVWIGAMGGLASIGATRTRLWLGLGGLCAFGLLVIWLSRVAARELREAGFHDDETPG
ncbi:MAG: TVP38/TMEM64 family protein [Pseudomonadota bacterium]